MGDWCRPSCRWCFHWPSWPCRSSISTLAFIRRTYAGKLVVRLPDKQHLHHRLLERGHSQRRAVMLMYVWSALVSFGVIILGLVQTERQWAVVAVVAGLALVLLVVTLGRPLRTRNEVRRGEAI